MASVEDIETLETATKAIVVNVSASVDALLAQVAALTAAGPGVATQADLDAIATSAQEVKDSLTAVAAKSPVA